MRNILIIKVGMTLPSLLSSQGDFEDWVLSGMGVSLERTLIADVRNGSPLPAYAGIDGVAIMGSHAMVTEHQEWSERTAEWLHAAVGRDIPTLGICYGHQLLAYALGGEVGDNPKGLEFGTVDVHLHRNAQGDLLLGGFASPVKAHVSHAQAVLRLPENARRLASSALDVNQAFVVGHSAWGVQFHPEFNAGIVRGYIEHFREALRQEDKDPDLLIETCVDSSFGPALLKRFVEIVDARA